MQLPPIPDHPEPHSYKWSKLEKQTIEAYGRACVDRLQEQIDHLHRLRCLEIDQELRAALAARETRVAELEALCLQITGAAAAFANDARNVESPKENE